MEPLVESGRASTPAVYCIGPRPSRVLDYHLFRTDRRLDEELVHVAPAPILAGLEAPHDGVLGLVKVFGRVLTGRVVAAPDVTALLAQPEVDPATAGGKTLLATGRRPGLNAAHLGEVRATDWHGSALL
jgi:hypothetical protein